MRKIPHFLFIIALGRIDKNPQSIKGTNPPDLPHFYLPKEIASTDTSI